LNSSRRPESATAIAYGPLTIGYSVTISSKRLGLPSGAAPHLRENTRSAVPIANTASLLRSRRSKRIVRSSSTTARATPANAVW
jgi:hypothetical protein